jgi:hypothetical protein
MNVAVDGIQGVAEHNALGHEVEVTAAASSSMKESSSAAPSSAALLNSTPSRSPVSLRDSTSAPGTERTMGDVMVIPLKNPGLGTRTPSPAG